MFMKWTGQFACLALLALTAASCGSVQNELRSALPQISLSALNTTAKNTIDQLKVSVAPLGDDYIVTLDSTSDLPSELFMALDYDETLLHAVDVQTQSSDDSLSLAVEGEPGCIDFGMVSTDGTGLDCSAPLLTLKLAAGAAPRKTSAAENDAVETRARNLSLVQNDEQQWELSWDYTNPGDTNQNSSVGIDDLTPLGAHFKDMLSEEWNDPLRHVDCDGNGQVGISDLTPIGAFYKNDIFAYKIQMSLDGYNEWLTVGELLLDEQGATPNETVRFTYTFGAQYVSGAWYRVQPQTHTLELGAPSEAVCENGRILEGEIEDGDTRSVVVSVNGLPQPMTSMNGCRIIYPDTFSYVPLSFNVGSLGGERSGVDGLWATFATGILFPPDAFVFERDLGNGYKVIDFNVTPVNGGLLEATPAGHGDLLNFELHNDGGDEALTLSYVDQSEDGVKRTYFSGPDAEEHFFGNTLSLSVK